jgi:hypothetical protein
MIYKTRPRATVAEIMAKPADDVGMVFWMCEECARADLHGLLPESPASAGSTGSAPTPARLWMSDEKIAGLLENDEISAESKYSEVP